jgi:transcriptional regulator with XRE-family HTH domain
MNQINRRGEKGHRSAGYELSRPARLEMEMIEASEAWEEQVEKNIRSAGLGERIKRLRLKRSMGLVELGRRSGLSASYLSQLETGRVIPTLRNLSRIALVFGKDLDHFFADNRQSCFRISRGNVRSRITVNEKTGSMISESMSALVPDRTLVPCIAEFPLSDSDASFLPRTFEGEEFVYVLSGAAVAFSASKERGLEEGDVLWVDGNVAREYRCKAGQTAKLMIVTCPLTVGDRPLQKTVSMHF